MQLFSDGSVLPQAIESRTPPEIVPQAVDVAVLDMNHAWPNLGHASLVRSLLEEDEAVREMVHAYEPDGPQLDSAGEVRTDPTAA